VIPGPGNAELVSVHPYGHTLDLSVRQGTDANARPLVLLHGIGTELERWGAFRELLTPTTIAFNVQVDHLGSSPSMRRYAHFVAAALAELDLGRVDVLGLSWGGLLAQQLAHDHPEIVRRLVLASTSPGFLSVPARPSSMMALLSPKRDRDSIRQVIQRVYGGDFKQDPELASQLGLIRYVDEATYRKQLRAILGWTSVPWLASVRKKTLILHGNDDPMVPFINAKIMRRLLRESRLKVATGGGHLFLLTRPEQYAALVNGFLSASDARALTRLDGAPDDDGLGQAQARSS
jgi:pimeloyl-ACP methyl ester carboxylesterase